jgi:tripartite-type tricarboxylate transporter receptor subunit TctC
MIDLLGGRVQVMFDTIPQTTDYIRDGKLRAWPSQERPA